MTRPTIVCLCGSTRFATEFAEANERETLAGKSVGISLCGANIDQETLRRVVAREL